MTFLEVLTRTCRRPNMLAVNQLSLKAQTCTDWQQTVVIDEVGRGIGWAQANLAVVAAHLVGDYIWILDDDDECIRPSLVEELKVIAVSACAVPAYAENDPDVIMLRMDHGPLGVLPDDNYWNRPPAYGHIGASGYVVKRQVWQAHANAWLGGCYHSDFDFINDVWSAGPAVYWHDVIASRIQRISEGVPEWL